MNNFFVRFLTARPAFSSVSEGALGASERKKSSQNKPTKGEREHWYGSTWRKTGDLLRERGAYYLRREREKERDIT